jgi:hypothetical protein
MGCIITTFILSTTFVFANSQQIEVLYNNIKIKVNGNYINPDVEPFIKDGRVFVPAKFIAEPLGALIKWDDKNNTMEIDSMSLIPEVVKNPVPINVPNEEVEENTISINNSKIQNNEFKVKINNLKYVDNMREEGDTREPYRGHIIISLDVLNETLSNIRVRAYNNEDENIGMANIGNEEIIKSQWSKVNISMRLKPYSTSHSLGKITYFTFTNSEDKDNIIKITID